MGTVPKKVRKKSLSLEAGVLLRSNNDPFYSSLLKLSVFEHLILNDLMVKCQTDKPSPGAVTVGN